MVNGYGDYGDSGYQFQPNFLTTLANLWGENSRKTMEAVASQQDRLQEIGLRRRITQMDFEDKTEDQLFKRWLNNNLMTSPRAGNAFNPQTNQQPQQPQNLLTNNQSLPMPTAGGYPGVQPPTQPIPPPQVVQQPGITGQPAGQQPGGPGQVDLSKIPPQFRARYQVYQRQQLKEAINDIGVLEKAFGRENVIKNWDKLQGLNPMFSQFNIKDWEMDSNGIITKTDPESGQKFKFWIDNKGDPHPLTGSKATEANARMAVSDEFLKAMAERQFNFPLSETQIKQLDPSLVRRAEISGVIQRVEDPNTNRISYSPPKEATTQAAGFRYPVNMPAPGMVGVTYSKRSGKYTDSQTGQELTRAQVIEKYGEGSVLAADKSALKQLTDREALITTFTNRIEANVPIVLDAIKDIKNNNPRLINQAFNNARQYLQGSGKWVAAQTAIISLSNEIQRVESNSLGIGGQGQEERAMWRKIHDPNMTWKDWEDITKMILKLGRTARESIGKQKRNYQIDFCQTLELIHLPVGLRKKNLFQHFKKSYAYISGLT